MTELIFDRLLIGFLLGAVASMAAEFMHRSKPKDEK